MSTMEKRRKLEQQADALRKRMATEASDLDYETQRYALRAIEKILEKESMKDMQNS